MINLAMVGNKDFETNLSETLDKQYCANNDINLKFISGADFNVEINEFQQQAQAIIYVHQAEFGLSVLSKLIKQKKHVFIANPEELTLEQLFEIKKLEEESDTLIFLSARVARSEVFKTIVKKTKRPLLIDLQLVQQTVSPIVKIKNFLEKQIFIQLMAYLPMVSSGVRKISASSFLISGDDVSLVNARIEFENGCVLLINAGYSESFENLACTIYQRNECFQVSLVSSHHLNPETLNLTFQEEIKNFTQNLLATEPEGKNLETGIFARTITNKILEKIEFYA
jgi:hypothetical protein